MLMHATAHGGCTDTVRESALNVNSVTPGTPTRVNIVPGFSVGHSTNELSSRQ